MEQVESFFEQAVQLHGAERVAFLERACAGEPALFEHVRKLLEADERAERLEFLPSSPPSAKQDKGSLEPGKLADLAVLSLDIFTIPAADLPRTESLLTLVAGKIIYLRLQQ